MQNRDKNKRSSLWVSAQPTLCVLKTGPAFGGPHPCHPSTRCPMRTLTFQVTSTFICSSLFFISFIFCSLIYSDFLLYMYLFKYPKLRLFPQRLYRTFRGKYSHRTHNLWMNINHQDQDKTQVWVSGAHKPTGRLQDREQGREQKGRSPCSQAQIWIPAVPLTSWANRHVCLVPMPQSPSLWNGSSDNSLQRMIKRITWNDLWKAPSRMVGKYQARSNRYCSHRYGYWNTFSSCCSAAVIELWI